tara:strand:- start:129 stop:503 length:375 start_codon:yes stop_codon:yes gene_type:complete
MLTSKYFIQFADFMVNLFNRNTQLVCDITNDIDILLSEKEAIQGWHNVNCKSLGIDTIIEKRLLDYYNINGKEMQLILDKNSLRFNKYKFKNYIIAKSEQDATKIRLKVLPFNKEINKSEVNMD